MKKRKGLSILVGSICLVLILVAPLMAACAPAPPAEEAPAAPTHEEVWVDVLGCPFGLPCHTTGLASADMAKKNHPWLRMTAAESPGFIYNLECLEQNPALWHNTIALTSPINNYFGAHQMEPFKVQVMGMRSLFCWLTGQYFLVTFDPDIKTINDLVGKKVALGWKSQIDNAGIPDLVLDQGWGILDQIDTMYVGTGPAIDALIDGLADAAIVGAAGNPMTNTYIPFAGILQLQATGRPVTFLSWGEEQLKAAEEKSGMPLGMYVIPAGAWEGLTNDIHVWRADAHYGVKDVFPEDVAYEIVKLHLEYYEEAAGFFPAFGWWGPDYFTLGLNKRNIHPGALRAFEEAGITIPD